MSHQIFDQLIVCTASEKLWNFRTGIAFNQRKSSVVMGKSQKMGESAWDCVATGSLSQTNVHYVRG